MNQFRDQRRTRRALGRFFAAFCVAAMAALGLSAVVLEAGTTSADAATVSFSQCNGHEAGVAGAALSVTCSVSIVNTIDATGGTSAVTYLRVCTLDGCTGDVTNTNDVINAVHQCNNSDNGGGSNTVCSVDIVNNISANAPAPATALTLDQCNGSGQGGGANVNACIPTSQGSPAVTQCNGSGNGGGATLVCTASGTTSAAFPVSVDQCNGSENGGGSTVTCSVTMTTNIIDTSVPGGGTPGGGTPGGGTPGGGTPGGGTPGGGTPGGGTPGTGTSEAPPSIQVEAPPVTPPVVVPPSLAG
jgi:hypothetical protein